MKDLFREEVMASQADRLYGEVILRQSVPARVVTAGLLAVVAACSAFVVSGRYARIETAKGVIVPTGQLSKIYAPRLGIVSALFANDGATVQVGQRLAVISADQPSDAGVRYTEEGVAALGAQEDLARDRIGLAGRRAVTDRIRLLATLNGLARQEVNLANELGLQRQVVASNRSMFEQLAPVVEEGFVSKLEVERRRQNYLSAQQQEMQLRSQLDGTRTQIAQAKADLARIPVEQGGQVADARTALEGYRQEKSRLENERAYAVTAPVAGRITALQAAVGKTVGGQVPLMTIIADGVKLEADVYVSSRAIGFIHSGQEVRLLYDAFPYQRFGSFTGRIGNVSRVIIAPNELDAPLKIEEPVYKVKVALDVQTVDAFGQTLPVQSGMTLTANIVLERQSFWDWLMAPLHAVTNRS